MLFRSQSFEGRGQCIWGTHRVVGANGDRGGSRRGQEFTELIVAHVEHEPELSVTCNVEVLSDEAQLGRGSRCVLCGDELTDDQQEHRYRSSHSL